MPDSPHVFISYARFDGRDEAESVYHSLMQHHIGAWYDRRNIDAGQDFSAEIEEGIERATHVTVCVTPGSKRPDSFVRNEIQYARLLKKPIIPLRFEDIPPHVTISTYSWIDFFNRGWDPAFDELLRWLRLPSAPIEVDSGAPNRDPFRKHTEALAQYVVNELRQRVFNVFGVQEMLQIHGKDTPDAVRKRHIPVAYQSRWPGWMAQNVQTAPKPDESLSDAFERHQKRVLLLGDPGAGKTTTLLSMVRESVYARLEDPHALLPVYAPIYTWNGSETLVDWLARVTEIPVEQLQEQIASKRTLLLLDGLDELREESSAPNRPDSDPQDHRVQFMEALTALGETPTLITCRVKDYDVIVERGGEKIALNGAITLVALSDEQIEGYLHEQADLWAAVQADDDLRAMVRTPLLLTLLSVAYKDAGGQARELRNLRASPAELHDAIFRGYVRRCYELESMRSAEPLSYTREQLYEVLGEATLTVFSYVEREDHFEIETTFFEQILGHNAARFIDLARRLHLLIPVREGVYRFIHLLVRDHFVIPLCFNALEAPDPQRRAVAVRAFGLIGDTRATTALIAALNGDEAHIVRWESAHALGELGDSSAVQPLIQALSDRHERVRWNAAWALGHLREKTAVNALIEKLTDRHERVRVNVAAALGTIRDASAVEPLIRSLQDNSKQMRRSATWSLIQIGTPAVDSLITALRHSNVKVRGYSARALGRIGDGRAVKPLIQLLRDNEEEVRWRAETALRRISEIDFDLLLSGLQDPDKRVRRVIVEILGETQDARAVKPLINVLLKDTSSSVSRRAGEALMRFNQEGVSLLIDAMRDNHSDVRHRAVRALGVIGDNRAVSPLIHALHDSDWRVRADAVRALAAIGGLQAVDPLIGALTDNDWHVRVDAARALARLGDAAALEALTSLLDDSNPKVREIAEYALNRLGRGEAGTDFDFDAPGDDED